MKYFLLGWISGIISVPVLGGSLVYCWIWLTCWWQDRKWQEDERLGWEREES